MVAYIDKAGNLLAYRLEDDYDDDVDDDEDDDDDVYDDDGQDDSTVAVRMEESIEV